MASMNSNGTAFFMFGLSMLVIFGSLLLMLLSYGFIMNKIPSTEEKQKSFRKCVPLLVVAAVHFECVSMIYWRRKSRSVLHEGTFLSVTHSRETPCQTRYVIT